MSSRPYKIRSLDVNFNLAGFNEAAAPLAAPAESVAPATPAESAAPETPVPAAEESSDAAMDSAIATAAPVSEERGGPVTLASLLGRCHSVCLRDDQLFVRLRLEASDKPPVSLLEGDGWLAFRERQPDGDWEVGVWVQALITAQQADPHGELASSGRRIMGSVLGVEYGIWAPLMLEDVPADEVELVVHEHPAPVPRTLS